MKPSKIDLLTLLILILFSSVSIFMVVSNTVDVIVMIKVIGGLFIAGFIGLLGYIIYKNVTSRMVVVSDPENEFEELNEIVEKTDEMANRKA